MQLPLSPRHAREALQAALAHHRWQGDIGAVVLAVHEAIVNAQHHGHGLSRVAAQVDGRTLLVEVCDAGSGPEDSWPASLPADPLSEGGRGLWLISQLARRVEVHTGPDGACLHLLFDEAC